MKDAEKTKKQLIHELKALRRRAAKLEKSQAEHNGVDHALRESEAKYRDLVENLTDAIYAIDKKGVITSCNSAAELGSGYSTDDSSQEIS